MPMKVASLAGSIVIMLVLLALPAPRSLAGSPDMDAVYAPFQQLLRRHLSEHLLPDGGLVSAFDYRAAFDDPETARLLQRQNAMLAGFDPGQIDTRARALAFWINAYNYFMIAWILENPRGGDLVESVRDYGHLLNPYRVFRRDLFDVGGTKHSLSGIELEILLGDEFRERGWWDARVHFMVNCASVGCPPLRSDVYTAGNVERLMAENTRMALDTPLHLDRDGETLRLTSLFDWYEQDFVDHSGSV
ncbi:MAG: DUF547 domain-containing protein, partial [Wenzhouxiangellaceae bacterium]